MILTCERCGDQTAKLGACDYCHQKICVKCMKSAKKGDKKRYFICKSCWGKLPVRTKYKRLGAPQ